MPLTQYLLFLCSHLTQQNKNIIQVPRNANDVIKLYAASGSTREYILVHGERPLSLSDLKTELARVFKIPPELQCIVYRGKNLHDYLDNTPLETFGLENNSPISVWTRGNPNSQMDFRFPSNANPASGQIYSPRNSAQPNMNGGNML